MGTKNQKGKAVTMTTSREYPVRIGAVGYLNSKPLIEGLKELAPEAELVLDYPSRLADELSAGRLDVALIPSVECLRDPEYVIVSDACVAAQGPVLSVKLYSRVPIGEIERVALDAGSRTSSALVQVLLAERYGVTPVLEELPLGLSTEATRADAILLIGDRAMHGSAEHFVETWDLGEQWLEWTGLPFVFALWAARRETEVGVLEEALSRARDWGVGRLEEIARREAPLLGISEQTAYNYLSKNLHYRLGSAERNGLKLFRDLAVNLELLPLHSCIEDLNLQESR
jgi:chorismate dehydratase